MHHHLTEAGSGSRSAETIGPSNGAVVLDIGGDRGALVVRTPGELEGREIEIRPLTSAWDGTHVAIRFRPIGETPVFAAVFGGLREGAYELRMRPVGVDAPVHQVEVGAAGVTEVTWPHRICSPDPKTEHPTTTTRTTT